MNRGNLISFKVGEEIDYDYIMKFLSKDDIQKCLENEYFKHLKDDKYIFTQKGSDFAWSKD